ncbi:MAG TPA: MBL fold metallo-hydrolase [Acidiferrobacterales bacterium]
MSARSGFPVLPYAPAPLAQAVFGAARRVLLFGAPGTGKSTLAAGLAQALAAQGRGCVGLGADPGSAPFGVPGALNLADWRNAAWSVRAHEPLCTLDAARFRLPLIAAVRRLAAGIGSGAAIVDAPGVIRGVAGAELLPALCEAAGVGAVLVLARDVAAPPLTAELAALGIPVSVVPAAAAARRPGRRSRARARTRRWDEHLAGGVEQRLPFDGLEWLGTPPPRSAAAWAGRQLAVYDGAQRLLAMGEAVALEDGALRARLERAAPAATAVLVRDAQRLADGLLGSAPPAGGAAIAYAPPSDLHARPGLRTATGPRPVVRLSSAAAMLVNGVFGDPLLHLRLKHWRRSLLVDLGEAGRLPARIAHQVSDVLVSHAHVDHIAGFLWLLRSRIGVEAVCRLYGPPGLAGNIQGLLNGVHWDRIGERGPRFEVGELHGSCLKRFRLQAGHPAAEPAGGDEVRDGVIIAEPEFRVRAVTLDHGTPVLAFAFETARSFKVRKERLAALQLPAGPWLAALKRALIGDDPRAAIVLPDGRRESAAVLAERLILVSPGEKLAYATDLADTPANRAALAGLAHGAHTLFCEAVFLDADAAQARRTGHLTARACGEIAAAAGVERLVPFHFSRRYQDDPRPVYDVVRAACPATLVPRL